MADPSVVLDFWFAPASRENWFGPPPGFDGAEFDAEVRRRLGGLHDEAAAGGLAGWEARPDGALALLILLDQAPRNIFRGVARAFATDPLARAVADRAIAQGHDLAAPAERRNFFYLPFEHSEDLADQDRCCVLVAERADAGDTLKWAHRHRVVIERFGRFPHRNDVLGRKSTQEEDAYLASRYEPF